MTIVLTRTAEKQIEKLPQNLQNKLAKQFNFLKENSLHPSLRARKKSGSNEYEARIDLHYRFSYEVQEKTVIILAVGPHDEGLGKK
ncbi:MAG: hypothetical protein UY21_C0002G0002 [Microgenomates group bacterium GW2011_GWA1_48_10]|uniref:Addiction module toxin RelE n=1 Tax=Candidatus Gottesmanbacteria bacterium RIFCSPHIGHO2_01_FULL_47_48 TaxID=1798381 RepID=A0A1F5ZZE5_9BACT|nr:MAG: hypothetical protein UY21_C0002G0002 [Microgenomates group bacterium GW2011_GWA1_48_10]OGG17830.1 MAG: hypothetical protein A2721_02295 [Candidatus Gottesmanbacteria bacterium RIFCSPHIGHO2_01_FULL_47_48]